MFFDAKEKGLEHDPPLFYEDKQKKKGNPVILTLIKGGQGDLEGSISIS